jgi:hypothetical protein
MIFFEIPLTGSEGFPCDCMPFFHEVEGTKGGTWWGQYGGGIPPAMPEGETMSLTHRVCHSFVVFGTVVDI